MKRDYTSAPVSQELGLALVITGLIADLDELRAGKISPSDAIARSMLAKQIFNGVRLYLIGQKYISAQNAPQKTIKELPAETSHDR